MVSQWGAILNTSNWLSCNKIWELEIIISFYFIIEVILTGEGLTNDTNGGGIDG